MKKLSSIMIFLLFVFTSQAQLFTIFGKEIGFVYVGPKVGGVLAKISESESSFGAEKVLYKPGVQLGIVGKIGITNRFAIQPEINFYQKGVKTEFTGGDGKFKTNYIGIPLLAKFALAKIGVVNIHIDGGVYSNVRVSGEAEWNYDTGETYTSELDNESWRRVDYGFAIGGGFEYPLDKGIWVFDLRYDYSFMDIHTSDNTFNSNRSLGVTVTYLFDLVDFYFKMKNKNSTDAQQTE